jgi:glycosyltransferase involved in cell wall biosynthesis
MRILVAHNFYQQPGGEDECVAAEVAMLRTRGHEVIQYCLHNDAIKALNRVQAASRAIWSRPAYNEVRELIRRHRPQIVHFHNTFPLISPAAYYAARAENVRVVQTLHNFRLLCLNAFFFRDGHVCEDCLGKLIPSPGIVHKCYRDSRTASAATAAMLTTHRALGTWQKAVDVFIALTQFSRHKFIQGRLPADKIVVKPNFVYPDQGLGAGTGDYGLFVGRLSDEKGLVTLLKAWKVLRESVPLKIVGDGPISAMVEESVANDSRIEWLGRKSPDEVYALIGEAKFLVCPSNCYETFGRVIVEAFAKGTPVIASNLGAMAELVDHWRTGLHFEPGNPVDLASAVQQLLADRPALSRMRQAARQEYEDKYTVEPNYRALTAIYEQVLDGEIEQNDTNDDTTRLNMKVLEC